jgi:hypothetical protein
VSPELATLIAVVVGMIVGLVGIVLPALPGMIIIVASQFLWALVDRHPLAWVAFAVGLLLAAAGWVLQYYLPGKRLQAAGVPSWVLAVAAVAGVVGFFVVPVIGLPLFFIGGVYIAESLRHRHATRSLRSTWHALKAAGLSLLIELGTGMIVIVQWVLLVLISQL